MGESRITEYDWADTKAVRLKEQLSHDPYKQREHAFESLVSTALREARAAALEEAAALCIETASYKEQTDSMTEMYYENGRAHGLIDISKAIRALKEKNDV